MTDQVSVVSTVFPRPWGRYVLLHPLAQGGMGALYLAKYAGSAGFERYCVIKTLRKQLTEDVDAVNRFLDEARVVAQLTHSNISSVFDVGQVDGRYYLAMDYIAGFDAHTLAQRCLSAGRPLTPGLVFHIVGQVLDALDYAHRLMSPQTGLAMGIVHRDISPNNVMISFEGEVKLIDFGLALSTMKNNRTEPNLLVGKVAYMAPEQATGDPVDARADQWAVAVMTYELLTGEEFYAGVENKQQIWMKAALGDHRPPSFSRLEPGLRAVLDRALAKDKKDRYPTCADFRDALDEQAFSVGWRGTSRQLRKVMEEVFAQEVIHSRQLLFGFSDVRAHPTLEVLGQESPVPEHKNKPPEQIPIIVGETTDRVPAPISITSGQGAPTGGAVPRAVTAVTTNVMLPLPPLPASSPSANPERVPGPPQTAPAAGPLRGGAAASRTPTPPPVDVADSGFRPPPKTNPGQLLSASKPAPPPAGIAPAMASAMRNPPPTPSIPEPPAPVSGTVPLGMPRDISDPTEVVSRVSARAPGPGERAGNAHPASLVVVALLLGLIVAAALAGTVFRDRLVPVARANLAIWPELDDSARAPPSSVVVALPAPPPPAPPPPPPPPVVVAEPDVGARPAPPPSTAPLGDKLEWLTSHCAQSACTAEAQKLSSRKKPSPKDKIALQKLVARCLDQCHP